MHFFLQPALLYPFRLQLQASQFLSHFGAANHPCGSHDNRMWNWTVHHSLFH